MAEAAFKATFYGTTTILLDDGHDAILIDGFFTRPSLLSCLIWGIAPDESKINTVMQAARVDDRLRAVLVAHSHYDHAMDAPSICKRTGALLIGSDSTSMIGLGNGLSQNQIQVVSDGQVVQFGAIRVTIIEGIHSPGDKMPGRITAPLTFPCAVSALKTGKCYSYLVEHGGTTSQTFIHPSANFVPGKLDLMRATTVFLGVGVLGKQTMEFQELYWKHVVEALGAKKIIPIHWDNFWRNLDDSLVPMPWFIDAWARTKALLESHCSAEGRELYIPEAYGIFDL